MNDPLRPLRIRPRVLATILAAEAEKYQPRDDKDATGILMNVAAQVITELVDRVEKAERKPS